MAKASTDLHGSEWIEIGVLTRAHGLKGGVFLRAHDRRKDFGDYTKVLLRSKGVECEYSVNNSYVSAGQPVLVLDGIESREALEPILQSVVCVSRSEVDCEDADVLVDDLVGLLVIAKDKGEIGRIVSVVSFGAQDNIEIKIPDRKDTVLFPLLDAYVESIDVESGVVTIQYVAEFLEEST